MDFHPWKPEVVIMNGEMKEFMTFNGLVPITLKEDLNTLLSHLNALLSHLNSEVSGLLSSYTTNSWKLAACNSWDNLLADKLP